MNTPTPREEFEEWLETFYENSNILSPRSLAWEAWQASQKELTAAREELKAVKEALKSPIEVELYMIRGKIAIPDRPELEYIGQIKTLTEQRDRALQKIKNQTERITYLEGATNHATGTPLSKAIEQRDEALSDLEFRRDLYSLQTKQLDDVREQRDRLAEALERILDYQGRFAEEEPESIAREALKSLITNK